VPIVLTATVLSGASTTEADNEDGVVDNNVDGTAAVVDKSMDGDGVVDNRDDLIVLLVPTCGSTGVV